MHSVHGVLDNAGLTVTFSPARSLPKINCIPSKGNQSIIPITTSPETKSDLLFNVVQRNKGFHGYVGHLVWGANKLGC